MAKSPVDCSELSRTVAELSFAIAKEEKIGTIEEITKRLQEKWSELDQNLVIESIIEWMNAQPTRKKTISKIAQLKKEAKQLELSRQKRQEGEERTRTRVNRRGRTKTDLGQQEKTAKQIKKLERQLTVLNRKIDAGDITPAEGKEATDRSPYLLGLEAKRDAINAEVAEARAKIKQMELEANPELQQRLEEEKAEKKATQDAEQTMKRVEARERAESDFGRREKVGREIEKLEERLRTGDYAPPQPRVSQERSRELAKMQWERDQLRHEIQRRIRHMKPMTKTDYFVEAFNLSRTVKASTDLSAVLRQGGFFVFGLPVNLATAPFSRKSRGRVRAVSKSFIGMLEAAKSKQRAHEIYEDLLNRENAGLYDHYELFLAPPDTLDPTKQEENYKGRWSDRIPVIAASNRAYATFLNVLRANMFDVMHDGLGGGQVTEAEGRAIAHLVNIGTGRGTLGQMEKHAVALNTGFFAPRYVASRFQLISGEALFRGGSSVRVRKAMLSEYARYLLGLGLMYQLMLFAFEDDEDFSIEFDPRSADVGKIRFGNTRMDPLSGISQTARFVTQLATREQMETTSRKVRPIRPALTIGKFLRTKLAPIASVPLDYITGSNVIGEEREVTSLITPSGLKTIADAFLPFTLDQLVETIKSEHSVDEGTAIMLAEIFGVGVQMYEDKASKKRAKAARKGEILKSALQ